MRKALKIVIPVLLLAALVMIVAPRIWVKNKKARLIYHGRSTEDFLLFHGSGGRMLVTANIPGEAPGFMYVPGRGVASCGQGAFVYVKLATLETRTDSRCTWFRSAAETRAAKNSLQFLSPRGAPVEVLWQDAPR